MDVFLDMTGTITDMESENRAFLKMCEAIAKKFKMEMDGRELMKHIIEFRRPYMERRHEKYYPIRNLIVMAVQDIMEENLSPHDAFWIVDAYSRYHARYVKLVDGGMDALREIREMAEHMGLITDADRPYTEKVLKGLGIDELFDSVTTAEDAGVGKPNPKIFQMALKNSRSSPKIYIGDSESRDIVGGIQAGMITIKVRKPSAKAHHWARSLPEVVDILKSL